MKRNSRFFVSNKARIVCKAQSNLLKYLLTYVVNTLYLFIYFYNIKYTIQNK